jgi:electron transport protein HydN
VKCDLCADRPEGPCCIEACPTNSLHLVDREVRTDNLKRKRVEAAQAEESISSVPLTATIA